MKYYKIITDDMGHPEGIKLFHGEIDEVGQYRRCGPYTPPFMLPLCDRLIVNEKGMNMLMNYKLAGITFRRLTDVVAFDVDWLDRIENRVLSSRHWERGSVFRGARRIGVGLEKLWHCWAERVEVESDSKWIDDRCVSVPVLSEARMKGLDIAEFDYHNELWQVVSAEIKDRFQMVAKGAFKFYPVSVW